MTWVLIGVVVVVVVVVVLVISGIVALVHALQGPHTVPNVRTYGMAVVLDSHDNIVSLSTITSLTTDGLILNGSSSNTFTNCYIQGSTGAVIFLV